MARRCDAKPVSTIKKNISKEDKEIRQSTEDTLKVKNKIQMPSYLSPLAKKEWQRLMRLYKKMEADILSSLDLNALVIYCEAVAIYQKAQEIWVNNQGVATLDKEAQKVLNQVFKTMREQSRIISSYASDLCLTPIGRAKIGMAVLNYTKEEKEREKQENPLDLIANFLKE